MTSTVVHVLVERGVFDYDTRIADVWPESGANGKHAATLRHALTTPSASLPCRPTPEDLCDWDRMFATIAEAAPWWKPGTKTGYHAQTFGWIVGETVRRATGKPISRILREEVAGPLGVADELYFGVPESQLGRLARLDEPGGSGAALASMPDVARQCGFVRLVTPERLREISAVAFSGLDQIMGFSTNWGLGYGLGRPGADPRETMSVFGMVGMGGSAAYADTATGIAFALTRNRLDSGDLNAVVRVGEIGTATGAAAGRARVTAPDPSRGC